MKHWKVTLRRQAERRAHRGESLSVSMRLPTWRHCPNNPVRHTPLYAFEALRGGKAAFAHARGLARG
jgi:hypothetical protein